MKMNRSRSSSRIRSGPARPASVSEAASAAETLQPMIGDACTFAHPLPLLPNYCKCCGRVRNTLVRPSSSRTREYCSTFQDVLKRKECSERHNVFPSHFRRCHRLERRASPRRICAVTRGFQTTTRDLPVFPFLSRHYHI